MNNLGERLKEQRIAKHYTQDYVASYLHVSQSAYANWERNHSSPDYDKLVSLCDLYQVSADFFLGRTNEYTEYPSNDKPSCLVSENYNYSSINQEQAKVLNYYDRLDEENRDYIRGTMVKLIKEQDAEKKMKKNIS